MGNQEEKPKGEILTEDHLKPQDGSKHSPQYYACVSSHAGECGSCSETGQFTPCD